MGILDSLHEKFTDEIIEELLHALDELDLDCEALSLGLLRPDTHAKDAKRLRKLFLHFSDLCLYLQLGLLSEFCALVIDILNDFLALDKPASDELVDWLILVSAQVNKYKQDLEQNAQMLSVLDVKIARLPENLA